MKTPLLFVLAPFALTIAFTSCKNTSTDVEQPPQTEYAQFMAQPLQPGKTVIPDSKKEKIIQPFFTTKPTGEGTGLGLSLTYDMVVKGHGGKIEVNTGEGEFTEFIISLPQ